MLQMTNDDDVVNHIMTFPRGLVSLGDKSTLWIPDPRPPILADFWGWGSYNLFKLNLWPLKFVELDLDSSTAHASWWTQLLFGETQLHVCTNHEPGDMPLIAGLAIIYLST